MIQPIITILTQLPPADVSAVRLYAEMGHEGNEDLAVLLANAAETETALRELDRQLDQMRGLVEACIAIPAKPADQLVLGI